CEKVLAEGRFARKPGAVLRYEKTGGGNGSRLRQFREYAVRRLPVAGGNFHQLPDHANSHEAPGRTRSDFFLGRYQHLLEEDAVEAAARASQDAAEHQRSAADESASGSDHRGRSEKRTQRRS